MCLRPPRGQDHLRGENADDLVEWEEKRKKAEREARPQPLNLGGVDQATRRWLLPKHMRESAFVQRVLLDPDSLMLRCLEWSSKERPKQASAVRRL